MMATCGRWVVAGTQLFISCAGAGLERILYSLSEVDDVRDTVAGWVMKKPQAVKRVDKLLAQAGYDRETIMAQTLTARIDDFERGRNRGHCAAAQAGAKAGSVRCCQPRTLLVLTRHPAGVP
jgi:hypothetical protein